MRVSHNSGQPSGEAVCTNERFVAVGGAHADPEQWLRSAVLLDGKGVRFEFVARKNVSPTSAITTWQVRPSEQVLAGEANVVHEHFPFPLDIPLYYGDVLISKVKTADPHGKPRFSNLTHRGLAEIGQRLADEQRPHQ